MIGANAVGKATLACNIAHQALLAGHTVLFTAAGQMLGELATLGSDSALRLRLRHDGTSDRPCGRRCSVCQLSIGATALKSPECGEVMRRRWPIPFPDARLEVVPGLRPPEA
nr:ATP-binding protein [Acidiferrobacter sp. SPIII_3]